MNPDMTSESRGPETDEIIEGVSSEARSASELESMPEDAAEPAAEESAEALAFIKNAQMIVDALGITWAAFQLYPDPVNTEAWERAMDLFRASDAYPSLTEVGVDSFLVDGTDIEATVEGTARMIRALFVHEVSALSFPAPPTGPDLVRLFEILQSEPKDVARTGGVRALLVNSGVSSLGAITRAILEESDDSIEAGRHSDVKEIVDNGLEPQELAARVLAEAGPDPDAVTEHFTVWYQSTLGLVATDDFMAREALVTIFAEAFFYFDAEFKLSILEYLLASRTKPEFEMLLDQFSGHELAAISADLNPDSRHELHDYARGSTDEGRPDELLGMLQSASEVEGARRAVAGRITELLEEDAMGAGRGATFARLRSEIAAMPPAAGMGRRVLRDLLAIEERDDRFRRVLRVWTGKVARSIHESDLDEAEAWLDAALEHPSYRADRQGQIDDALEAMATDDLMNALVTHIEGGVFPDVAVRLIEAWGPRVVRRLVDQLAEEEDPTRRRALIDILATISSRDASSLLSHLSDSRWYLVRNLAIALGKTGRPEVAPRLRNLAHTHADHRVRVEALRSLMPVSTRQGLAAAVRALSDDHKRVRQAASTLLSAAEGDSVDQALIDAFNSKEGPLSVRLRLIEVLGARGTEAARAALQAVANKRSLLGPGRTLRSAAQQALKGQA